MKDNIFSGSIGYIKIKKYINAFYPVAKKNLFWKIPVSIKEKIHIYIFFLFTKISLYSDHLFIVNPHAWNPAISSLIVYLQKKGFLDTIDEIPTNFSGYSFFLIKKYFIINGKKSFISGQGIDTEKDVALSKAVGEILERTITGVFDNNKNVIVSSYRDISKTEDTIYPPKYHKYLDIQREYYRELNIDDSLELEWVCGKNIVTGKKTYIPKQITSWFAFKRNRHIKNILVSTTSSGCAGHFDPNEAIMSAVLECVERDGFLTHWLTTTTPTQIEQETLPDELSALIIEFKKRGVNLYILDIMSLDIPTVCIVGITPHSKEPRVLVSCAAKTTYRKAIKRALEELISLYADVFFLSHKEQERTIDVEKKPFVSDVSINSRSDYWVGRDKIDKIKWWITGDVVNFDKISKNDFAEIQNSHTRLNNCIGRLKANGPGYYPVIYSPHNKIQKEVGYTTIQAFIPKAFPLYLQECHGTFDSARFIDFLKYKKIKEFKLNTEPHPFV